MNKSRLEAFSDGVIAIVITLLVLEIRLPEVGYADLGAALYSIMPKIMAYVVSFALIGLYWVFHHYSLNLIDKVDGVVLWINILFLLFISFLPFPTIIMGRYPFQPLSVIMYSSNLLLINATGFLSVQYLKKHRHLASAIFTEAVYKSQMNLYAVTSILYVLSIGLAFFVPAASYFIVLLLAVFLIIRSALLARAVK
jgi:uncharacterized membrane protein